MPFSLYGLVTWSYLACKETRATYLKGFCLEQVFLIYGIVFVSCEVGTNVSCEESTVSPRMGLTFLTQCECYVITLKCIIFIFSAPKTKRSVIFASLQNKNKQTTSIFSTQHRFFLLFLLGQQSYRCFTGQTISQFFLTLLMPVWTAPLFLLFFWHKATPGPYGTCLKCGNVSAV